MDGRKLGNRRQGNNGMKAKSKRVCRSPLRWVGGKSATMPRIVDQMVMAQQQDLGRVLTPAKIVIPFSGGFGSDLVLSRRWPMSQIISSDIIPVLSELFHAFRDPDFISRADALAREYEGLPSKERRAEWYYDLRRRHAADQLAEVDRLPAMFVMNRTCFQGLYKLSAKEFPGKFWTAHGFGTNRAVYDRHNLAAFVAETQGWSVQCRDFEDSLVDIDESTIVYLDPPYKGTFDEYNGEHFDQGRLAPFIAKCFVAGALQVVMSQSHDCDGHWFSAFKKTIPYNLAAWKHYVIQRIDGGRRPGENKAATKTIDSLFVLTRVKRRSS